jgi:hypothetical protein
MEFVDRRNKKDKKKHNWSNKGGHIAPIFVPPTPDGELAKMLREIAENEAEAGINFRIVETGGCSIKSKVQKSNPTATTGCTDVDCLPCETGSGDGGNCRSCGTNYQIECALCPAGQSLYHGETSRNLYTRSKEHLERYKSKNKDSFMLKHQENYHQGVQGSYSAKVTASGSDCLTRQVREAVLIRRCEVTVMNGKNEWHQPALFRIQSEIERG